jgi:hypothetical protein
MQGSTVMACVGLVLSSIFLSLSITLWYHPPVSVPGTIIIQVVLGLVWVVCVYILAARTIRYIWDQHHHHPMVVIDPEAVDETGETDELLMNEM